MYGGDEVGAMVMDMGTTSTRFGFAGEIAPRAVFNTALGYLSDSKSTEGKSYYVGHNVVPRANMEMSYPVQHGVLTDWEGVEQIWNYALGGHIVVEATEHPMLISECSFNDKETREKLTELMFEKYQVPAMFLVKDAVLAAFSLGKSTALVVDCGGGKTSVTPVSDGFVLKNNIRRTKVAGSFLDQVTEKELFINKDKAVQPGYMFNRKWVNGVDDAPGKVVVTPTGLQVTSSYNEYAASLLVRNVKQTLVQLSISGNIDMNARIPHEEYELPDGTKLSVGMERFSVAEPMFTPHGIAMESDLTEHKFAGLTDMIAGCVDSLDVDMHKELYGNMIFAGGNTCYHKLGPRIRTELQHKPVKVKVINGTLQKKQSRLNAVWKGGSVLGSLGAFHQMWLSKAEYEEHGASVISKRMP